jgi:hypothetical protein
LISLPLPHFTRGSPTLSIDQYAARSFRPFAIDDGLYEVRLLTILPDIAVKDAATRARMTAILASALR